MLRLGKNLNIFFAFLFLIPNLTQASTSTSQIASICDNAAELVSRESTVPLDVLRAISLTETGRRKEGAFQPWPWTVNMEGVGKWFENVAQAQDYVDEHFSRGARSFDVGCFQINYRWHGAAFSSIEEMFDPIENARYAARFLTELYDEMGDWSKAAGAYHSRTPKYARKYTARFNRIRSNLPETIPVLSDPESSLIVATVRPNTYPLLKPGRVMGTASLVPLGRTTTARFLDISETKSIIKFP